VDNSSGITVSGIEVVGGENGLAFTFGESAEYSNFTVQDCFFNQISGLHYNASSGSWWGSAIAFAATHSGVQVSQVTIAHNLVNGSDVFYSNSVPYAGWTRAYVTHLLIASNAITSNSYNTLFLDTTSFVSVLNNVFLDNRPTALFTAGTTDIIMGTLNASNVLAGNELSGRGEFQPGGPDGCAIDFETNATGVSFTDNYISRSFGAGAMIFGHVTGSNTGLLLTNNTFINCGCQQTRDDHGAIAFMRPGSSGLLSDNIFLSTIHGCEALNQAHDPGIPGWVLEGNTISGVDGAEVLVASPPLLSLLPNRTLTASSPTPGTLLHFTLDGSRPRKDSPQFPASGLELTDRATPVFIKAFWSAGLPQGSEVVRVESESAGGIFAPPE